MPREFSRSRRVGEEIRRTLAQLLHDEVKDPGVGMVTLTTVKMSPDLSLARVYFTALAENAEAEKASEAALRRASGFLRRELGRRVKLRITPELQFVYDRSVEDGRRLTALIEHAVAKRPHDADDDGSS